LTAPFLPDTGTIREGYVSFLPVSSSYQAGKSRPGEINYVIITQNCKKKVVMFFKTKIMAFILMVILRRKII
jgi:hypothetical protein